MPLRAAPKMGKGEGDRTLPPPLTGTHASQAHLLQTFPAQKAWQTIYTAFMAILPAAPDFTLNLANTVECVLYISGKRIINDALRIGTWLLVQTGLRIHAPAISDSC